MLDPKPWGMGTEFHDGLWIRLSYYTYDLSIEPNLEKILSQTGSNPYESTAGGIFLKGKLQLKSTTVVMEEILQPTISLRNRVNIM